MIRKGQLRRWNKRLSSLDGKLFLALDCRIVSPEMLGLHQDDGDKQIELWSTLMNGIIQERTTSEIEDFSEPIDEAR